MDEAARERLEAAGFKSVTVAEFLNLSPEEEALVEIKAALSKRLRELRQAKGLTQDSFGDELRTHEEITDPFKRSDGWIE